MQILSGFLDSTADISKNGDFVQNIDWSLIYGLLSLATNLICTLLIVYQIICLAYRLFLFRNIISALIESCTIYTLVLIVYLVLVGMNLVVAYYADIVAAYIKVKISGLSFVQWLIASSSYGRILLQHSWCYVWQPVWHPALVMRSQLILDHYHTYTLAFGQWGKVVLALTTPVTRAFQDLTEQAQLKVYDFKFVLWRYFSFRIITYQMLKALPNFNYKYGSKLRSGLL